MNKISSRETFAHPDPLGDECRGLWAAVMLAAVEDAVKHGDDIARNGSVSVKASLSYFDSRDCEIVCDYLGLERSVVRKRVHDMRAAYLDGDFRGKQFGEIAKLIWGDDQ